MANKIDIVREFGLKGYSGLAAAIIYQANQDAEGGDFEALGWFGSEAGSLLLEGVRADQLAIDNKITGLLAGASHEFERFISTSG